MSTSTSGGVSWLTLAAINGANDHPAPRDGQPDPASHALARPHPTGPHPVGREALHLVDHTRPDPRAPEAEARELMVSMYYPARTGAGRTAAYPTLLNGLTPENPEAVSHRTRGTSLAGADVRGLRDR